MPEAILDELEMLRVIAVYHKGTVFYLAPGQSESATAKFGGTIQQPVQNCAILAKLHQFLTTDSQNLGFAGIPLLYGITHDGCELAYSIDHKNRVTIEKLRPSKSSSDWPYTNYPEVYPVVDLQVISQELDEYHDFLNLLPQGCTPINDEACTDVIVPPHPNFGISLWGEDGDLEMVQVVFSIDPRKRLVVVENQCT